MDDEEGPACGAVEFHASTVPGRAAGDIPRRE